jgi:hypothetical protein
MDIWDILLPFGTFCVHLVHFFRFWYHLPRKIWQPWLMLAFAESGILVARWQHNQTVADFGRFKPTTNRAYVSKSGLPDFLRYKISMREKCTKLPQNTIPNGRKIGQTAIKYVDQYLPL